MSRHIICHILWAERPKSGLKMFQSIFFSKLVCAEVSKTSGTSERVFHQTVNAQNSMLTKEIHDQGKINFILKLKNL